MSPIHKKKRFRLFDAVLATICIVLAVEAVAPAAAIGTLQYFWWGFLLLTFFLPYALISSELGSTYHGEGGVYDWVKQAFGLKAGARLAWYYWVSFPIWMVSLAVMITDMVPVVFGVTLPLWLALLIQLLVLWLVIFACNFRVNDSKFLINTGAAVKIFLIAVIGFLGIWAVVSGNAPAAADTTVAISPLQGVSFISIILFNFTGCEVVVHFSDDMENPKKQIPAAIIIGGVLVAFFYLFAAFGIGSAIPADQLSIDSGFLDSFMLLTHSTVGSWVTIAAYFLFVIALISNLISWAPGVNVVAMYAARDGALPKAFGTENKHEVPLGANIGNGAVASVLLIAYTALLYWGGPAMAQGFWGFFALSLITELIAYVYLFPAFLRLRRIDSTTERPFKIPGGPLILALITYVPMALLLLGAVFTLTYFDAAVPGLAGTHLVPDTWLIIGTIISLGIGEVLAARALAKAKKDTN
jgi:amino acid transporter